MRKTASATKTSYIASTGIVISIGESQSTVQLVSGKELEDDFTYDLQEKINMRKMSSLVLFLIWKFSGHKIVLASYGISKITTF